ncbi:MAG: WYL domain-containing protein, partial [Micromonosporaceae bacterium]
QATLGIEPVVTVEPTFGPLTAAAGDRQAVTFSYRPPEADSATVRRLQPWGVVCWRGKWYVVGHDLDREAPRCFRLSRIVGEVRRLGGARAFQLPQGIDLIDYVARWSGPREHPGRATVLLRPGRAAGVRRTAERVDGDTAVLRYSDPQSLAGYLVGYGADVVVLDPPDVRDAVVALLERTAQRYPEPVAERKPAGAAAWSREVVR